jgi:dTDP-4-dehydrorhamnose 3,5-epimerase
VQDNHSYSRDAGTVRGLHFQSRRMRRQSWSAAAVAGCSTSPSTSAKARPPIGKWFGGELSAENGKQMLIPAGFLHGFVTRDPDSELLYKCTDFYAPDCDGAVRFDDPDLGIDWGIDAATGDPVRQGPRRRRLPQF